MDALPAVTVESLGTVAAARLVERCADAMSSRLRLWSKRFTDDLERARQPDDLRSAMSAARSRLIPLRALASSPLLFEELREGLEQQLKETLGSAQRELEEQARRAGDRRETVLRIVREQPLDRAVSVSHPEQAHDVQTVNGASRHILLG